jgi:hypothetical protein
MRAALLPGSAGVGVTVPSHEPARVFRTSKALCTSEEAIGDFVAVDCAKVITGEIRTTESAKRSSVIVNLRNGFLLEFVVTQSRNATMEIEPLQHTQYQNDRFRNIIATPSICYGLSTKTGFLD